MARGSEKISARWLEGAARVCVSCGAEIKNLARDVGQVMHRYDQAGKRITEVRCMACRPGQKRAA